MLVSVCNDSFAVKSTQMRAVMMKMVQLNSPVNLLGGA